MSIVFKSTLTIRSFVSLLALALLICLIAYPHNTAEASSETTALKEADNQLIAQTLDETPRNTAATTTSKSTDTEGQSSSSYTYRTQKGDNLTYFARRSIQLYLETRPSTVLETSQIIAAETHIVQTMGAFDLEVGQIVMINLPLVVSEVELASQLSEQEKSCWASYEPIRQSLTFLQLIGSPSEVIGSEITDTTEDPGSTEEIAQETVVPNNEKIPKETQTLTTEEKSPGAPAPTREEVSNTQNDATDGEQAANATTTNLDDTTLERDSDMFVILFIAIVLVSLTVWLLFWTYSKKKIEEADQELSDDETTKEKIKKTLNKSKEKTIQTAQAAKQIKEKVKDIKAKKLAKRKTKRNKRSKK